MTSYFPVALNIEGRRCLVVGGGAVAARKVDALLSAGALVAVVAPEIVPAIAERAPFHTIELHRRGFEPGDLADVFLVVAATNDSDVNAGVAAQARSRRVLVNAADDPANCDFILPAVVRRGEVQIAITTGARSPALARHLRERLEDRVPRAYGLLVEVLARVRDELRREGVRADPASWQEAIDDEVLDQVGRGDLEGAIVLLRTRLDRSADVPEEEDRTDSGAGDDPEPAPDAVHPEAPLSVSDMGHVILVGAGPGDPGLITVAGQRAIAEADVVVYDRLVSASLLNAARGDARLIFAGKARGRSALSQTEINELLCVEALAGQVVVRLKGGDPFVFGRGGEEALAVARAGIPFTVIPGVTAAVAAPAFAGIPVTHRGLASAFTVITGHEDPSKPGGSIDWEALARLGGTLVLLMGVETLSRITKELIAHGLDPETPAAVVQAGSTQDQRIVTGVLADIAERARAEQIRAPATTVVGQVAALADQLAWRRLDRLNAAVRAGAE